ncbi:unnamed protein product [Phaedon cochleariae]|uniref:C2H2-type domain-containing protein n=1 Tax=Phaedon cochleariae TaxID=80249 RepID=A0A9N9SDC0_PHACE|nr:unnamed protein product [Phaedon cochleariae]
MMKLLRERDSKIGELSDKLEAVSAVLINSQIFPTENDDLSETTLDLFNDFPIKDDGMLANVESKLANEETYKKLVHDLSMIGGRDYKECSKRFLRRIIDDKFACGYSMLGRKKKRVFRSTMICACLLDFRHQQFARDKNGRYMCPSCISTYKQKGHLVRHIRYECGIDPKFTCHICFRKFKHKCNLNYHHIILHKEQLLPNDIGKKIKSDDVIELDSSFK